MLHLDRLPNCKPGERPVLFLRRHWITVFRIVGITLLAILAPVAVLQLLGYTMPELWTDPARRAVGTVFLSMYALSVATFFFQEMIDYYLDTWIVTTERVIDIEQNGLFNRVASEMHIALVQDSTTEIKGILHTFLDYGEVFVQTAGEKQRFTFHAVPHPEEIRETVLRLADLDRKREGMPAIDHAHVQPHDTPSTAPPAHPHA